MIFAIPGIVQAAAAKVQPPCKLHIATVIRKRVFLAFLMGAGSWELGAGDNAPALGLIIIVLGLNGRLCQVI